MAPRAGVSLDAGDGAPAAARWPPDTPMASRPQGHSPDGVAPGPGQLAIALPPFRAQPFGLAFQRRRLVAGLRRRPCGPPFFNTTSGELLSAVAARARKVRAPPPPAPRRRTSSSIPDPALIARATLSPASRSSSAFAGRCTSIASTRRGDLFLIPMATLTEGTSSRRITADEGAQPGGRRHGRRSQSASGGAALSARRRDSRGRRRGDLERRPASTSTPSSSMPALRQLRDGDVAGQNMVGCDARRLQLILELRRTVLPRVELRDRQEGVVETSCAAARQQRHRRGRRAARRLTGVYARRAESLTYH